MLFSVERGRGGGDARAPERPIPSIVFVVQPQARSAARARHTEGVAMKRLLTTVAFSALIFGGAAPLVHAADPAPTTPGMSSTQTTPANPAAAPSAKAAQATPSTATGAGVGTATPAAPVTTASSTPVAATPVAATKKHAMRRGSHKDHMADELNRQELAQITGSGASSYGSSR